MTKVILLVRPKHKYFLYPHCSASLALRPQISSQLKFMASRSGMIFDITTSGKICIAGTFNHDLLLGFSHTGYHFSTSRPCLIHLQSIMLNQINQ